MRGLLAILAVAMVSATTLTFPAKANSEQVSPGDKMVCKHRKKTGTRFTTKECKTAAQWEAMAEENRRGLSELVNRPQISLDKGN